jgi:hypothetical protein
MSTVQCARRTATHLARVGTFTLNGLDDVHALDDFSEDDVLAIEPVAGTGSHGSQYRAIQERGRHLHGRDEELGSVAVGEMSGSATALALGCIARLTCWVQRWQRTRVRGGCA